MAIPRRWRRRPWSDLRGPEWARARRALAARRYDKVIDAGVDRPAAHFNLGLLYQQRFRFEPAIAEFNKSVDHPRYTLGSHFALGECYKALGRVDEAFEHFVQVLKIVDLGTV